MKAEDIEKLTDEQFAKLFNLIVEKIKEDPIENFIKAKNFIDFHPSAAQEVIMKVIFQKPLDDQTPKLINIGKHVGEDYEITPDEMTEVEIYEYLTDKKYDPEKILSTKVNKIDLILGRRSGKSTMSAMLAIYFCIITNWKPFLRKTPYATVLIMSHSKDFTEEILDLVKQFVDESPILRRLVNKNRKQTASTFNLVMPFIEKGQIVKSQVQIKVGAASSKTTRGVAACAFLADEIAYWNLEENLKETDKKIMKAVRPATKQFGKHAIELKLSSPGIKQGVLYEEYKAHRDGELPASYEVFKAPSWVMNTILPVEEFIEEYLYDPDGFDVEYGANFADSLSNFISPTMMEKAVLPGIKFMPPSEEETTSYFAAIDAAFKGDVFTFSLVGLNDNRVTQYISQGWKGTKRDPVKAQEVAEWIRNATRDFPINYISADQFAFQPLKEIFDAYNLELRERVFNPTFKKKIYFNLKNLIHRQQIDLLDSEIQNKEICELVVEQANTGTVKIGHPSGGSDDYADSLAIACYEAVEGHDMAKFEFNSMLSVKTNGVVTDQNGVAFTAPSAEMLVTSGHLQAGVMDNTEEFVKDPHTGKLVKAEELEEDDRGGTFLF